MPRSDLHNDNTQPEVPILTVSPKNCESFRSFHAGSGVLCSSLAMNLDQLHNFIYRTRTLRFELVLLQEENLTLEFDYGALAETGWE